MTDKAQSGQSRQIECLWRSVLFGQLNVVDCFKTLCFTSVCKLEKISEIPGEWENVPGNTAKNIETSYIILKKIKDIIKMFDTTHTVLLRLLIFVVT